MLKYDLLKKKFTLLPGGNSDIHDMRKKRERPHGVLCGIKKQFTFTHAESSISIHKTEFILLIDMRI